MDLGKPFDFIIVSKEEFEDAMKAFPATIQDEYSDGGIMYMDGRKWGKQYTDAQGKRVDVDSELGRHVEGIYYLNPVHFKEKAMSAKRV